MTNYYQILGVPMNASSDQIKAAYREYAKHLHPDIHKNSDFFKKRFQEVQQAYEKLSDSNSRKTIDLQFNSTEIAKNDAIIKRLEAKNKELSNSFLHIQAELQLSASSNKAFKQELARVRQELSATQLIAARINKPSRFVRILRFIWYHKAAIGALFAITLVIYCILFSINKSE